MTSGPGCYLSWSARTPSNAPDDWPGATDPSEAAPGTIRGDLGINLPRNSVHASDCVEAAEREIALIFAGGQ